MHPIRPIAPHEWPAYRALRLRSLADSPDAFGSTHALEAARPDSLWSSRLEAAAHSGKDLPLFALDGEAPCGLLWCKIVADDPALADLFQMWVAPEHRGRGLGGALLREAIAWARASGVRRLRLGVTVGDTPASRLYATHGFVPVGEPEPLREGSVLRAQAMELALR